MVNFRLRDYSAKDKKRWTIIWFLPDDTCKHWYGLIGLEVILALVVWFTLSPPRFWLNLSKASDGKVKRGNAIKGDLIADRPAR